jgi:molecular chaperone DnaK (HSP70)
VSDAVLLVPEFWTGAQRTLYKQLAALAGLNVKATINELTAVAVDFGNRNLEGLAVGKH